MVLFFTLFRRTKHTQQSTHATRAPKESVPIGNCHADGWEWDGMATLLLLLTFFCVMCTFILVGVQIDLQ
jgi:Ca2+/H+ antiporter